jgi:hypothetical protein
MRWYCTFAFANGDWTISSNNNDNITYPYDDGCFNLNMSITSNKIVTDCLCFEFERQMPVSPCRIYLPLEKVASHTHLYRVVWKHVFPSNVFPSDIKYFEFHRPSKPCRLIFSANFVCGKETRGEIRWNTLRVSVYISVYLLVFIFLFFLYFLIFHSFINLCSYLRSFFILHRMFLALIIIFLLFH